MGFYIDWVSVKGLGKDETLSRLGLLPTDEAIDWPRSNKAMFAETPNGRVIVVINDYGRLKDGDLRALSNGVSLVAGRAEGNDCTSSARGFHNGRQLWSVSSSDDDEYGEDEDSSDDGLIITGRPPAQLSSIRKRLAAEKAAGSEDDDEMSYSFEAPLELAGVIGGWAPETSIGVDLKFFAAADGPVLKSRAFKRLLRWLLLFTAVALTIYALATGQGRAILGALVTCGILLSAVVALVLWIRDR